MDSLPSGVEAQITRYSRWGKWIVIAYGMVSGTWQAMTSLANAAGWLSLASVDDTWRAIQNLLGFSHFINVGIFCLAVVLVAFEVASRWPSLSQSGRTALGKLGLRSKDHTRSCIFLTYLFALGMVGSAMAASTRLWGQSFLWALLGGVFATLAIYLMSIAMRPQAAAIGNHVDNDTKRFLTNNPLWNQRIEVVRPPGQVVFSGEVLKHWSRVYGYEWSTLKSANPEQSDYWVCIKTCIELLQGHFDQEVDSSDKLNDWLFNLDDIIALMGHNNLSYTNAPGPGLMININEKPPKSTLFSHAFNAQHNEGLLKIRGLINQLENMLPRTPTSVAE